MALKCYRLLHNYFSVVEMNLIILGQYTERHCLPIVPSQYNTYDLKRHNYKLTFIISTYRCIPYMYAPQST